MRLRIGLLVPCLGLAIAGLATTLSCSDTGTGTGTGTDESSDASQGESDTTGTNDSSGETTTSENTSTDTTNSTNTTETTSSTSTATDSSTSDSSSETSETGSEESCPHPVNDNPQGVQLKRVLGGLSSPVYVVGDPRDEARLYILEKTGTVRVFDTASETLEPTPALTLRVKSSPNEMGLLGMAWHPNFPEDPRVYFNYNPADGSDRTRVSEFKFSDSSANMIDPASERILIEIDQPEQNHNGGMIEFGADGMLYIGMGDGGGAGDKHGEKGNGQNTKSLLGKILRVDVEPSGSAEYTVPSDNPFVGNGDYEPEIWALGLRNPWRFSFDPVTNILYCGDVGQGAWEEVSVLESGKNYGWREAEGFHCYGNADCGSIAAANQANEKGYVSPISEYSHDGGQASITGGYVYRYCEVPSWQGHYFYADYVTGRIYSLEWNGQTTTEHGELARYSQLGITSFGVSKMGNIYATAYNKLEQDGELYRLEPK